MNQIMEIRRKRNMSREQLACLMNMSVAALGRREREDVPLLADEACRFAEVLRCSLEDILGEQRNEK